MPSAWRDVTQEMMRKPCMQAPRELRHVTPPIASSFDTSVTSDLAMSYPVSTPTGSVSDTLMLTSKRQSARMSKSM